MNLESFGFGLAITMYLCTFLICSCLRGIDKRLKAINDELKREEK